MDRSNTRNMRGGKARFVQRNHTHSQKSPQVKKGKFATTPSSPKAGSTPLVPKLRFVEDAPGRRMQSPQLRCARDRAENRATGSEKEAHTTEWKDSKGSNADTSTECTSPIERVENPQRPWCRCMLIMPGFELYYLCYEAEDGVPCAPVLTGKDGRILYCTDSAKIPRMLAIGREDLAALGEPDLDEMVFASIPDALEEYRDGVEYRYAKNLNDTFDVLTELLANCGSSYDNSILSFLLNCFCNHFNTPKLTWEELAETEGYRNLTVEEGIQLALGIVLTKGRHVA